MTLLQKYFFPHFHLYEQKKARVIFNSDLRKPPEFLIRRCRWWMLGKFKKKIINLNNFRLKTKSNISSPPTRLRRLSCSITILDRTLHNKSFILDLDETDLIWSLWTFRQNKLMMIYSDNSNRCENLPNWNSPHDSRTKTDGERKVKRMWGIMIRLGIGVLSYFDSQWQIVGH